jgi:hypothetical protein
MENAAMTDGTDEKPVLGPGEDLPAFYTNYFHAHVGPQITRIAFGEQVSGSPDIHYRLAVAMTTESAKLLIGLISDLIAKSEQPTSPSAQKGG